MASRQAAGPYVSHLDVDHCTFYASHRYGALGSESSGRVRLTNSIVAQMGSLRVPALTGHAGGDHNCLWHVAVAYGKGWNGAADGRPGAHDVQADPGFLSRDPSHPLFLRISTRLRWRPRPRTAAISVHSSRCRNRRLPPCRSSMSASSVPGATGNRMTLRPSRQPCGWPNNSAAAVWWCPPPKRSTCWAAPSGSAATTSR